MPAVEVVMFEPTVPKWIYDQKCADYDKLFAAYEKLRLLANPATPIRQTSPRGDSGQEVLRAAEKAVQDPKIAQLADQFVRERGISHAEALKEAARLNAIARGKAVPVSPAEAKVPA